MTVLEVKGQTNAAVILKGLLQQHGLPGLTPEGIDTLSKKFETGLVVGHGVVSRDGRPLIDELRALASAPENSRFFANAGKADRPGTLTERYRSEIAANRKQARMPDDWQDVRGRYDADSVTGQMLREREREWR